MVLPSQWCLEHHVHGFSFVVMRECRSRDELRKQQKKCGKITDSVRKHECSSFSDRRLKGMIAMTEKKNRVNSNT